MVGSGAVALERREPSVLTSRLGHASSSWLEDGLGLASKLSRTRDVGQCVDNQIGETPACLALGGTQGLQYICHRQDSNDSIVFIDNRKATNLRCVHRIQRIVHGVGGVAALNVARHGVIDQEGSKRSAACVGRHRYVPIREHSTDSAFSVDHRDTSAISLPHDPSCAIERIAHVAAASGLRHGLGYLHSFTFSWFQGLVGRAEVFLTARACPSGRSG